MMDVRSELTAVICAMSGLLPGIGAATDYEGGRLSVRLTPRTPEQMAAFYEARGFERAMIDVLRRQCFITVLIKNTGDQIVWLDLQNWVFHDADGPLQRRDRVFWRGQWNALHIPLAHQSTFRWTLLPERLDFRPGEQEGGNIILPRTGRPLTMTARFDVGSDRTGQPIRVKFENVRCAEDP